MQSELGQRLAGAECEIPGNIVGLDRRWKRRWPARRLRPEAARTDKQESRGERGQQPVAEVVPRAARHGEMRHGDTETQRIFRFSLCLRVSVADGSAPRQPCLIFSTAY